MHDDLVVRLRQVSVRLARELNALAAGEGLTPSQAFVLSSVVTRGPITTADLGQREGMHPSMLSRIVAKLDRDKLVVRQPHPSDQRVIVVSATPAGRALHGRVKAHRTAAVQQCAEELAPALRDSLVDAVPALEQFVVLLEGHRGAPQHWGGTVGGHDAVETAADANPPRVTT